MSRFRTEADLCRDLIAAATAQGWVAYPETAGWDLVLVGPSNVHPLLPNGAQIGVESKLRGSLRLAGQIAAHFKDKMGPDWIAAAVGTSSKDFDAVARILGVLVLTPPWPNLIETVKGVMNCSFQQGKISLPKFPPRVEAGARSPSRADRWKMAGLRTLARIEVRGAVTTKDLRQIYADNPNAILAKDGIEWPGWFGGGWLVRVGFGPDGALYALAPGNALPPHRWPTEQPEAYAEVLAIERRLFAEAR